MSQKSITKDMAIEEILNGFPHKSQKLAHELTKTGLHCVGCGAAVWETLESGVLGHGFTEEVLEDLLVRLNTIIEEESDPTTISLTKRAAEKFKEYLEEEGLQGHALRFGVEAGGCSGYEYILDFSQAPQENDSVFSCHGVDIHVNKNMVAKLLGSEIDYVDGLHSSGFRVSNPNAKGSCGCGKSQNY